MSDAILSPEQLAAEVAKLLKPRTVSEVRAGIAEAFEPADAFAAATDSRAYRSANDDHEYRDADVIIAACASAIAYATRDPWRVIAEKPEPNHGTTPFVGPWLAAQLSSISCDPVSVGSVENVTGLGRSVYVQAGASRLPFPDMEAAKGWAAKQRETIRGLLRPYRIALAGALATADLSVLQGDMGGMVMHRVFTGNTSVYTVTKAEADGIAQALNQAYHQQAAVPVAAVREVMREALQRLLASEKA